MSCAILLVSAACAEQKKTEQILNSPGTVDVESISVVHSEFQFSAWYEIDPTNVGTTKYNVNVGGALQGRNPRTPAAWLSINGRPWTYEGNDEIERQARDWCWYTPFDLENAPEVGVSTELTWGNTYEYEIRIRPKHAPAVIPRSRTDWELVHRFRINLTHNAQIAPK